MHPSILCYGLFLILGVWANSALAEPSFEYAGVDLETTDFKSIFPTSSIGNEEVWVSKDDSRDHAYYVRRIHMSGLVQVRIVLEKPVNLLKTTPRSWQQSHYARYPPCAEIFANVQSKYGKPASETRHEEERLSHRVRTWLAGPETLTLDCYRLDGKGKELAAEITIERRHE